ncbi:hypothetical protein O3G_MSEX015147 [Manduca sexta]|uniref:Uncharacterized protein n=1 Tax=Manduca sexta TaxID=7130 RepID=A0A921ZWM5_MANSE|nr:hypothetical protein O3G_MSEX015147 [Manduca sexta]
MIENGIDEDSDYGKNYKKNLHKKLLIKNNADDQYEQESPHPKEKKTKRKKLDDDDEDIVSPKKKKIKLEPESDVDTPKKKKKKRLEQQQPEESFDMSNVELSQDYDDLNITVKEELSPPSKSKKQRKSTQSNTSISSNHDLEYSMNNIKEEESNTESQEISCAGDNDETFSKKKKKKSKKRKHSICEDDNVTPEDNCSDGSTTYSQNNDTDTIIKKSPIKKEKSKHKQEIKKEYNSSSDQLDLSSDHDSDKLHKQDNKRKSHENSVGNSSKNHEKVNKRMSKISDGLKCEDANNSLMDTSTINKVDMTKSRKLKKFLKINENLKQISSSEHNEWTLNSDDEIWAVRCPQNIDVHSFLGTKIKLDRKCKVKIDDQTLVGKMNSESTYLTVLSSEHNDYVIKKLPLCGTLHLHTKVPKVLVPDNIILNNENDFVPLPNTKKRHPLFGSNYKKAIKVPSAVAQKLNESFNDSISENITKKKKKKKHKNDYSMDIDNEQMEETHESIPTDNTSFSSKKKNKKRKHDADNEHSSTKCVKHNADASAVWESEQAIEENLFNS